MPALRSRVTTHGRNAAGARVNWKFTTHKAREKLARAYPDTTKESESL